MPNIIIASQFAPIIVIGIGLYFCSIWDKGLRGIFYFYLVSGLLEIINAMVGGLPIIYHISTIIEVAFLLYIYNQWSDFNFKAVFIIYMIIWLIIKVTGLEPIQGLNIDILSTILASVIFIFIPMYIFDVKPYQKFFMIVMSIYYGGALVFFITINTFQDKVLAWELHSIFNIIAAIGSAAVFILRNNEIVYSARSVVGDNLSFICKE